MKDTHATLKRLRLGELPREWQLVQLCRIVKRDKPVVYGIVQAGPHVENGVPYIKSTDVKGTLTLDRLQRTSAEIAHKFERSVVHPGDIVFSLRGNIGELCIVPDSITLANLTQGTARISVNGSNLNLFVQYALASLPVQRQIYACQKGSTFQEISLDELRKLLVLLPPLPEQRKIAAILSTWDRAIELTEKLIAAKQRRKQALMQQLLTGRVRLPKFAKGERIDFNGIVRIPAAVRRGLYPPSVQPGLPKIGEPPSGWTRKTMGKLLQIEKRPIQLDDHVVYQLVVARRNRGGIELREYLCGRDIKTPTQFVVHDGDFVISRRQIIHGACGVVPPSLDGAIVSNEYAVCTVNRQLDLTFLKYLSHTLYFQQTCFHSSVGVALEKMIFRLEKWLKIPFLIPPIEEQIAISAVLTTMDNEIEMLVRRQSLLANQKKGLMQQLLTGKVRVSA